MIAPLIPCRDILSTEILTTLIQQRPPRAQARAEINVTSVPLRTCYEILTRLRGPREAVLDYAAALFSDNVAEAARPTPPVTLEEAHSEDDGRTLSLLLASGAFSAM
jgi:hypothetical protein